MSKRQLWLTVRYGSFVLLAVWAVATGFEVSQWWRPLAFFAGLPLFLLGVAMTERGRG